MNYNILKQSTDSAATIDDIIKCYICLGKIQDASMCPNCQKLTCHKCLQKWIIEKKNQCPHCRNPLRPSQVIKIGFMNDVTNYIDHISLKTKKETLEMCLVHSIQFLYYCTDCKTPLCSDCFMLEETHKSHSIKKMKAIYDTHRSSIKKEEEQLAIKCSLLTQYLKEINEKIIDVGNFKCRKALELSETFDLLKRRLENSAHDILSKLMKKKNFISEKVGDLEKGKKDIERRVVESSQSDLIKRSNDIIGFTQALILRNTVDEHIVADNQLDLSKEMQSDYYAPYQSSSFLIEHFYNFKQTKEPQVIYSPGIRLGGVVWRLKVYPRGNSNSNFEFLSVFLELVEGNKSSSEPAKYYYKIELVNSYNSKQNFYQEHSSIFEQGDCWGYNKFFKLEKILKDGFINKPTESLAINFSVRPETYCQLNKDLMYYIGQLEKREGSEHEPLKAGPPVKPKQKLSQDKNMANSNLVINNFQALSEESLHANGILSKSMRSMPTQTNAKIAKELFEDLNNSLHANHIEDEKKEEDLKEPLPKKKINRYEEQGQGHQYMHTIDIDPVLNMNKLSKVNISPIQDKKGDQMANLQKFQIDLSLDSQNEDDFKDFNFYVPKYEKSNSFDEDAYGFLMESLKSKEDKDLMKNLMNDKKPSSNKKEEKMNGFGINPFVPSYANNNNSNSHNQNFSSKFNPFVLNNYKNFQLGSKSNFEPKK